MALYYLTKGKHYGIDKDGNRRQIRAGQGAESLVELTPEQADAFRDKFKSAEVMAAEARITEIQVEEAKKIAEIRAEADKKRPAPPAALDAEAAKSGGKAARENLAGEDGENSIPIQFSDDPLSIAAVPAPGSGPTFEIPVTPASVVASGANTAPASNAPAAPAKTDAPSQGSVAPAQPQGSKPAGAPGISQAAPGNVAAASNTNLSQQTGMPAKTSGEAPKS
jgi:hypothetical protein